jgi:hypothetical protein
MNVGVSRNKKIIISVLVVLVAITVGALSYYSLGNEFYTTREVQLQEATILGKETDNGYFLELSVPGVPKSIYTQTGDAFYQQASIGQNVGALVGTVDKYKARQSLSKKQLTISYISTDYEVMAVYPTLKDAQSESKPATFTMPASLVQRIKSQDGKYFFLMDAGGKRQMAEVNQQYYDQYTPKTAPPSSFELEFEGVGEYSRFMKIVKP